MRKYHEVIKKLVITEKSLKSAKERNEYTFEVKKEASKGAIRRMVEEMFGVSVLAVRIGRLAAKGKRVLGSASARLPSRDGLPRISKTSPRKKAIVKLKEGDKIRGFETGE